MSNGAGWIQPATCLRGGEAALKERGHRATVLVRSAGARCALPITDALQMAINGGHVAPQAIFHSDRGTQYTSAEFESFTASRKIRLSRGRTGLCWDNAAAESFFATLKNEMYYRQRFATQARARFAAAEYIEVFYNRKRLHSTLSYRTPSEALTDLNQTAAPAAA